MMKKTIIMALVVLGAVSCAKEQVQVPKEMASFTIEAAIEDNATKTQISEADGRFAMEWSTDDSFALYDGASLITFNRISGTSQFTSDQTPVGNSFYAYYPASAVTSTADGAFTVTLPSTIEYTAGNITPGQFPMSGQGSTDGMGFRNLCALISVKLQADEADKTRQIKKVILSADKPICGKAKVAFGSDQLAIDEGGADVTIECDGVSLADAPMMHFTVPVGTYDSFVIRIETTDAGYAMLQLNGPFELKRSMDYSATLQTGSFCSPYVSTVLDVDLAPGQFINTLPAGLETKESAIEAIANVIVGSTDNYIHLGGWGGSVTVGFDHPIINLEGADFRGYGNAFGGSSEPGVYYVAQKDAEGKPAKWYLIRHSMYDYSIHDYTITYYKPEAEDLTQYAFLAWDGTYASGTTNVVKTQWSKITEIESKDPECPVWYLYNNNIYKDAGTSTATIKKFHKANCLSDAVSDENQIPDTYQGYPVVYCYSTTVKAFDNYIYWEDNQGHNGYECKNAYHAQSYWPEYAGESITITGEYLPVNSFDTSGSGSNYVQDSKWWGFPLDGKGFGIGAYGFCDNYPNADPLSTIDISWAVDENGNSVNLDHIDFIKVQSGVHKQSGWIGEISTEFCGIEDLHLLGEKVYPDTTVTPDIENIPRSNDPQQPASGLLYWSYTPVDKR